MTGQAETSASAQAAPARGPWWRQLGPGLITGIADDDPSGIAVYSQSGAQFGYALTWTTLLTLPLMAAVQMACGRIGRVTGHGLAENFALCCPRWLVRLLVSLLLLANLFNLGADLDVMADVTALLVGGGHKAWYAGFYAVGSWALLTFMPYERYVRVLKWMTVSVLAYVAVAFAVKVDWALALRHAVWPRIGWQRDEITAIVAVLGTTLSPYLFFWQASQEVEEIRREPGRAPLIEAPAQAPDGLRQLKLDTWTGMIFSNVIGFFMIVAAAATLHQQGITEVRSTTEAALALRPVAGDFAFWLFACGVLGTGLLTLPVLAGSAGYAVSSLLGWRQGLDKAPKRAKGFYGVMAAIMLAGFACELLSPNPIEALYWSAVINALIAVPIMAVVMRLAADARVMRELVLPWPWRLLGWLATAAMALACVAMLVMSLTG